MNPTIATPKITVTSTSFDPTTNKSSVTFSWYKASDGATETELIRYDVYDDSGNYFAQAVELGKTRGEFASGTVTVNNITAGIKVSISVYVSTDTQNSAATETFYSPTGRATFSTYTWNDTRTSCEIKATAPGAKYLRITAGSTPDGDEAGEKVAVGTNGTLTVSDLDHGNGEALYLSAIPEASDGHQYGESAAYSQILVPNPILGIYKSRCGNEYDLYIVDIVEKKDSGTSCTPRWQKGQRVKIVSKCVPHLDTPAFTDIVCTEVDNIDFGATSIDYPIGATASATIKLFFADKWGWDNIKVSSFTNTSNYMPGTYEIDKTNNTIKFTWEKVSGANYRGMASTIYFVRQDALEASLTSLLSISILFNTFTDVMMGQATIVEDDTVWPQVIKQINFSNPV